MPRPARLLAALIALGAHQASDARTPVPVPVSVIVDAMRAEQALGYNIRALSNSARLTAGILLRLARAAHARDSLGLPFTVTADAYEKAFLEVTQQPRDSLPLSFRISSEYHEDFVVEHRRAHVIVAVLEGPEPKFAINVHAGWADISRPRYSYEDRTGNPSIKLIHERRQSYTIVDYGDMVMHTQIRGVSGRVTSGLLKLVCDVLGDARAVEGRYAVASDGTEVARLSGRKGAISITQTVTVRPNGVAEKGVSKSRPDLVALEKLLKRSQKLKLAAAPN